MIRHLILFSLFIPLHSLGQMNWQGLKDIPKTWVMLQRDSAGYLVYKPCNGATPMITIDSGYITVYWQLDGPSKFSINKFIRTNNTKTFSINCKDEERSVVFNIAIKNEKKKLVLWTFGGDKWVMTPLDSKDKFRLVDNPCPTEMKPEKLFLPVEFK